MGKFKQQVHAEELFEDKLIQTLREYSIDNDHVRPRSYQILVARKIIDDIKESVMRDVIE